MCEWFRPRPSVIISFNASPERPRSLFLTPSLRKLNRSCVAWTQFACCKILLLDVSPRECCGSMLVCSCPYAQKCSSNSNSSSFSSVKMASKSTKRASKFDLDLFRTLLRFLFGLERYRLTAASTVIMEPATGAFDCDCCLMCLAGKKRCQI